MVAAILALLSAYSPVLIPVCTSLIAWLIPSPFQKKSAAEKAIAQAFDESQKTGRP